jgi:AraC-like DNA-binding protein
MYFLKSKKALLLVCFVIWGFFVALACVIFPKQELDFTDLASKQVNAWLFSDSLDRGFSKVAKLQPIGETVLGYTYTLHEGYQYPYVGLNFVLKSDSLPNLSGYDYLSLTIKARHGSRLPIVLGLQDEFAKPNGVRFMEYILTVGPDWTTTKVPLSQFRSPEWWLKMNLKKEADLPPPVFDNIRFLNVQSCQILGTGKEDTIEIKSIGLNVCTTSYLIWGFGLSVFYWAVIVVVLYRKKAITQVVFSYTKTEAGNRAGKEEKLIFDFITNNYGQANLSIADIQLATGVSENKVSYAIKHKTGLTFKQFLNKLRLTEGKRLLAETDLQVSEIAYKVGYSNVTHFNRIFKEVEACTPNDFRKQRAS